MSVTIEDLELRQAEIAGELARLDAEYAGQVMPEEARGQWNDLGQEHEANKAKLEEMRARADFLRSIADDPARQERGADFHTRSPRVGSDAIWDLVAVRNASRSQDDEARMLRENARRAIDGANFAHPHADQARAKERIEGLLERFSEESDGSGTTENTWLARRILQTGSPTYRRAFSKKVAGRPLSPEEERALSLTAASGGYAVPYVLDPTLIPTSNSSVNPYRAISRVETITTNEWRGVSSGAITVAYAAEGTEASDNTPTLAQPTCIPERCQAFIPFSMEVGGDWGRLQTEMAMLIQEGKDDTEASKFTTGAGHGSTEPEGLLVGATGTVAAGTAAFAIAHLYALQNALPARFQPRAQFVGHRATYNLVKQFDTSGGGMFWGDLRNGFAHQVPTPGSLASTLNGYPTNECSAYAAVLTAGSKILTLGDFRYFLIVDRLGMDIEIIPHLFGASGRPTGQRGMYAIWRNSSDVLSAAAFKTLQTT
ncbi:MAG: phage major capsid protein [Actinomycetota bacterium]